MAIRIAADAIALLGERIVLVDRKYGPQGLALPGGYLEEDESLEQTAVRELKEETGLDVVRKEQFRTYSAPGRDPRGPCVSTVFLCEVSGTPVAGDDAKGIRVIGLDEIDALKDELAFDHYEILCDAKGAIGKFLGTGEEDS